jgi:plastocyanin
MELVLLQASVEHTKGRPMRRWRALLAGALLAVCGCGSGGDSYSGGSTPTSPTTTTPPGAFVITVVRQGGAQSFSPNPAAAGGLSVVFRNADTVVHRVLLNDATIDTGDIAPGATSRVVQMPAAGTNYHCSLHPTMIGSVSAASGDGPPPCTGPYCEGG